MILADSLYRNVSPLLKQLNSLSSYTLHASLPQLNSALRFNRNLRLQLALKLSQQSLINPRLAPQLSMLKIQPQSNQVHRITNYILDKQSGKQPPLPSSIENLNNLDGKFLRSLGPALPLALFLNLKENVIGHLDLMSKPLVQLVTARVLQEQNEQLLQRFMAKCKQTNNLTQFLKANLQNKLVELDPQLLCDWEDPLLFSFFQVWLWRLDIDKCLYTLSEEYRSKFNIQRKVIKNFIQAFRCPAINPYRVRLQAQALQVPISKQMVKSSSIELDFRLVSYKDCSRLEQQGWGRDFLRSLLKDWRELSRVNLQTAIFLSDSKEKVKALAQHSQKMSQQQRLLFRYKQFAQGLISQQPARPVLKHLQVQHQKACLLAGVGRLENVEWSRLAGWLHRNRDKIRWPKECRQLKLLQNLSLLKESQLQLYKFQGGLLIKK